LNNIFAKKVPHHKIDKDIIVKGDSIEILKSIKSETIDVIFADPPYFMQSDKKVLQRADGTGEAKGCDNEWDKYKDYIEYDNFTIS
jgi:site-specific DNA-methyltransferase (adenine-specific)